MMRIALTADPEIPVPPRHYGGIERIVDMLARDLAKRGHEVTLFSHPASECPVPRVAWPGADSLSRIDTVRNAATLARHVTAGHFDIVHSFSRIAYMMPILPLPVPKIMTYQRAITPRSVRLGHTLSRGTLAFTAISDWMMRDVAGIGHWYMIPNGVPLDTYTFVPDVSERAPLVFLGRIEEIKGPDLAIEIARRAGRQLIIAGNISDEHRPWAEAHVLAHVDGETIRYIGSVDDAQKNALLGGAAAMLMPIVWDEPFGIVMAEAMACGTPVVGLRRGAVPEVVEDGITGFVRDNVDGLVAAVHHLSGIDRANCRARVVQLYSAEAVVERYLGVYRKLVHLRGGIVRAA